MDEREAAKGRVALGSGSTGLFRREGQIEDVEEELRRKAEEWWEPGRIARANAGFTRDLE